MIHKLPRWIWLGGATLALIAGMINTVGLLSFKHEAVSHLTGTVSLLGISAAHSDLPLSLHLLGLILSFFLGSILSGIIIKDSTLHLGQHYSAALAIESLLLFAAVPLLADGQHFGEYLASCACGLQNAMASTYSGAIIRTTHVTGLVTDTGILIGHLLRGLQTDKRRLGLCVILLFSFLAGGVIASRLHPRFGSATLCFPAAITGLAAVAYSAFPRIRKLADG